MTTPSTATDPGEDFVQPDLFDGTPIDDDAEELDAAPTHEHGDGLTDVERAL